MPENDTLLDIDKLKELLTDVNKLELSSPHNIIKIKWPIYQFRDNGWEWSYKNVLVRSANYKLIYEPVSHKLVDFLNTYVTPELANNEKEKYTLYHNLVSILFDEFDNNQFKRAVENKNADEPCDMREKELQDVLESQVELCLYKIQNLNKVKLISTLCPIEMNNIDELIFFQTENLNVKIRKWNKTERAVFASQNAHNATYASDNYDSKSPMYTESFVEIEYTFYKDEYRGIGDKKLQQYLFRILDLIKWAIMVLSNNPYPIREGTGIINTCNPRQRDIIKRDPKLCTLLSDHSSNFVVKPEIRDKLRDLIDDYSNTLNEYNNLDYILGFFGRACLDDLDRDRLIDSVIGLEIILVQSHEQLGYQFRLHGATILSTQWDENKISLFEGEHELFWKKEELVNWFKKLYNKRSTSVHGANSEYAENEVLSTLYALAVVIKGFVYLHKKGLLHDDDHEVSKAVGNYIIDKSVLKNVD
ncbi:HEPN domain-containing protein [Methanobacterium ferruginis]|uniref:HEPN domain-containing protein n=1 Tax=Methanobacterium ferruginis TaxID=710191 RepID=UPI002572BE1B|nr:HEPN domain-containing protein [Methanobacterium ferruginis]BDZ68556.1 hypothetical protein GCM10025860_20040 [Methanobacterium ferruginis]